MRRNVLTQAEATIAKAALVLALSLLFARTNLVWAQSSVGPTLTQAERKGTMKIQLKIGGRILNATLEPSATAKDFQALLPLTLTLKDFNSTEKISDLPKRLSEEGAPTAITPLAGDIAYYAPWGNLAIFYRDFRHSPGLIRLGRIDGAHDAISGASSVIIERSID